jgi:hypothetical protein
MADDRVGGSVSSAHRMAEMRVRMRLSRSFCSASRERDLPVVFDIAQCNCFKSMKGICSCVASSHVLDGKGRPHHLRDAAGIVAIRLVNLRLQRRLHVPCLRRAASYHQRCRIG